MLSLRHTKLKLICNIKDLYPTILKIYQDSLAIEEIKSFQISWNEPDK